jgi:hypothetical protein
LLAFLPSPYVIKLPLTETDQKRLVVSSTRTLRPRQYPRERERDGRANGTVSINKRRNACVHACTSTKTWRVRERRPCMHAGRAVRPACVRGYPAPTPTRHCPIARGQVLSLRTCSNYPSPRALNRPRACAGGPLEPVTDEATGTGSITTAYVVTTREVRSRIHSRSRACVFVSQLLLSATMPQL